MAEATDPKSESGDKPAKAPTTGDGPAKAPTTGDKPAKAPSGAAKPKISAPIDTPKPASPAPAAPAPGTSAAKPLAATGRRPLVSKEAKQQHAAIVAARRPFYRRIPKPIAWTLLALVVVAALVPAGIWGYRAYLRSQNPDEYAVREQLTTYRFDNDKGHFANLDAMGPKAVDIAIKLLVDRTPAEIEGSHSTTTAGELAMMYLMYYAVRVKVDAPPKATEATRNGLASLNSGQWTELQQAWTAWFANVQAKGLALK